MMRKPVAAAVSLSLWVTTLSGCIPPQGGFSGDEGHVARPLENQYADDLVFADIPVPRHFTLDARESFRKVFLDKGNVRIARLIYRGAAHPKDVVRFYDEFMPHPGNGWKKIRDEILRGSGAHLLVFTKSPGPNRAPEECKVEVVRARGATTVIIDLQ